MQPATSLIPAEPCSASASKADSKQLLPYGVWATKHSAQTSWLCFPGTLHCCNAVCSPCRPYLLPCLVVAVFGLATGAFCTVYMPETLPEAQVQRSGELLPKWLQPRSD